MLHKRQALGRDIHEHFSLAPARSDTNPPSNPQSAPAPSLPVPYKTGLKLAMRRREHHPCHSSLSLLPPRPACAPYYRPLPSASAHPDLRPTTSKLEAPTEPRLCTT